MPRDVCTGSPIEKQFQQLWIELPIRRPHHLRGTVVREAVAVRSRRGKSVINIGYTEDAGCKGDRFAGEAIGVPLAIPALVMIADDRAYVARKIDVGYQLESSLRMPLHDRPFFIREIPRFVQNLRRHDDLADIVQ